MDTVSAAVIEQLARTRGWTLFFSILLWIAAALLVLGGIAIVGLGIAGGAAGGSMSGMFMGPVIGVLYLLMALAYIYPALKLAKFSSHVSRLQQSPSEVGLVAALNEQRAFWKYVGIITIVFIVLYIVIIVLAIALPGIAAISGGA